MVEYQIPFVDEKVSTDDAGKSGYALVSAFLGILTLLGVAGAATWALGRISELAGVDDAENNIPGV